MLSCFYYVGSGERCGALAPPPALFCATHLFRAYHASVEDLLHQSAEALINSTTFNANGLLSLSCKDLDTWGCLSNCVSELVLLGYRREEEVLQMLLTSLLSNDKFRRIYAELAPPKWKAFEVLVARLHLQQLAPLIEAIREGKSVHDTQGVQVFWNYRVVSPRTGNERQVDVAIIAELGLYRVFIAVECKDTEVKISDVEAFVTKVQDIGAHRGVIVTSVGFQDGARRSAQTHNIEALLIEEQRASKTIMRSISRLSPKVAGVFFQIPNHQGPLNFTLWDIKVFIGARGEISAVELVEDAIKTQEPTLGNWPPRIERILPPESQIILPGGTRLPLEKVYITVKLEPRREYVSLELPDYPYAFSIQNVITGVEKVVASSDLPLRDTRSLEPGRFYINMMCQCCFCESIENNLMNLVLLSDKQHGNRITVKSTGEIACSSTYFPVEDTILIKKLQASLISYQAAQKTGS